MRGPQATKEHSPELNIYEGKLTMRKVKTAIIGYEKVSDLHAGLQIRDFLRTFNDARLFRIVSQVSRNHRS
jgi:hypothetical protein